MTNKKWFRVGIVALSLAGVLASATTSQAADPRADYIVTFKPSVSNAKGVAAVKAVGGSPFFVYEHAINGVAVSLPSSAVAKLRSRPEVAAIEADAAVSITVDQSSATWGLDRIDQTALPLNSTYSYSVDGSYTSNSVAYRVTAYIIDTGILSTHTELKGRVGAGYTAFKDKWGSTDCNGHGTHVSGTVGGTTYGVAKGVQLIPVRVLDCRGSGTTSGVIAGINWAIANHQTGVPAVANMSLGGGASQATDDAVTSLVKDGVVVAVAAGNSNVDACGTSPARAAAAITVGATDETDSRASFSNFGSCLDLFAPGVRITSSWIGSSNSATNTISGTSMATPHVAGVAALVWSTKPTASAADVIGKVIGGSTANAIAAASIGTNSPNKLLYSLLTLV